MLEMLVVALVTNAMTLAVAERHHVETARCDQLQAVLRAVRDALEHRFGEAGETFRAMVDGIAARNRVEPEPARELVGKRDGRSHKTFDRLEMGHPVDDVDAVDGGVELAMR